METQMKTVFYYPEIESLEDWNDCLSRAAWYLFPYLNQIEKICVPLSVSSPSTVAVPDYMDQAIANRLPALMEKVETLVNRDDRAQLLADIEMQADLLLVWKWPQDKAETDQLKATLVTFQPPRRHYKVDRWSMQYEGSYYLWLGEHCFPDEQLIERSRAAFDRFVTSVHKKKAYVLGTGPSLSLTEEMDLSDGDVIVCNSIVKNRSLMHHLQPKVLTSGDPIFHAGCSRYAAQFRQELYQVFDEFPDLYLFVPMRDYCIYLSFLNAEHAERLVALPFNKEAPYNVDLKTNFYSNGTPNVLTLLMLPVAATFYDEIYIGGCDGRPLNESNYFWKHDPKAQFNDKMENIKVVHPSFFEIQYNDYYLNHCSILEKYIRAIEKNGGSVYGLTPSYIPALNKRGALIPEEDGNTSLNKFAITDEPLVSIIVACHNAADTLEDTVFSIQAQDYQNWEVLAINDSSVDSTVDLLNHLQKLDSRIKVLECEGIGTSAARNTGLKFASGIYITFLDSDDLLYDKALRNRVQFLRKNPDAHVVSCTTYLVDDDLNNLGISLKANKEKFTFKDIFRNLHPNSLMGESDVMKSVKFDSEHDGVEDWVYLSRILRQGYCVYEVPSCSVAYRIRSGSVVMADLFAHEERCRKVLDLIYSHDPKCPLADPQFIKGLNSKKKSAVLTKRQLGLMVNLLLNRQGRQIMRLLAEINLEVANSMSSSEIDSVIRFTAIRTLACHESVWTEKLGQYNNQIIDLCEKAGLTRKLARFTSRLYTACGLIGKKISLAPNLTLMGKFDQADQASIDEGELIANLVMADSTENSVMVDIGAHHGGSSTYFSKQGWYIYAFEPDPQNRQKLSEEFENCNKAVIDERAVSDKSGQVLPFYASYESTGISTLSPFRDSHRKICSVKTTTIAEICQEYGLNHINFLKVDTEGYDLYVLRGVPWSYLQPDMIMCEFEDAKTTPLGYTFCDLAEYLLEYGYTVLVSEWHPVVKYGTQHNWHRLTTYPCELASPDAWGNLLAFREPPDFTAMAAIAQKLVKSNSTSIKELSIPSMSTSPPQSSVPASKNGSGTSSILRTASSSPDGKNQARTQPDSSPIALSVATVSTPEPVPSRSAYLLKRIARYYYRWPLGVAVLAVVTNCLGMVEAMPFRWVFNGVGSALILFLVGHAATRSERVIEMAQSTVDEAKNLATVANTKANRVIKQEQRTQKNLKRVRRIVNQSKTATEQANALAHSAKLLASHVVETTRQAEQVANSAAETANLTAQQAEITAARLTTIEASVAETEKSVSQNFQAFHKKLQEETQIRALNIQAEREARVADFIRLNEQGNEPPKRYLIQLTVPRCGSTLLTDALRSHPGIDLTPIAFLHENLSLTSGRYPRGLSEGPDAKVSVELFPYRGAKIPEFCLPEGIASQVYPHVRERSWAIEKIHPHAFGNNSEQFIEQIKDLVDTQGIEFKFIYQVRNPKSAIASYIRYQKRDSSWHRGLGEPFQYMQAAYKALLEVAITLPGLIIDYSDLMDNFAGTVKTAYLHIWDQADHVVFDELLEHVQKLTAKDQRFGGKPTPFLGNQVGDNQPINVDKELEALSQENAQCLDSCFDAYHAILRLAYHQANGTAGYAPKTFKNSMP